MVNLSTLIRLKNKPAEEHMKSIIKKLNSAEMILVLVHLPPSQLRDELVKAMNKKGLDGNNAANTLDKIEEFLDTSHDITYEEFKRIIKH